MTTARLAPVVRPARPGEAAGLVRLAYLDNIRVAVVTVVVVHHAAQAYGNAGGGWAIPDQAQATILRPFLAVNAAFGMGLMFLLAGYFLPHAYEHRGALGLIRERSLRLGVPLLIVSLGLLLPYAYMTRGDGQRPGPFLLAYLRQPEVGHLWFAGLLLVCTWAYTLWRWLGGKGGFAGSALRTPGHLEILAYTCCLGATTFAVRTVYPVDQWISPAPFFWVEPAHLPQYLSLFALGCTAFRNDWFRCLPVRTGLAWLGIGLSAAAIPYAAVLLDRRAPALLLSAPRSGLSVEAGLWTIIETLVCVGLCVGLVTLFREHANWQNKLISRLSADSYAVYIVHLLPVLGLQLALEPLQIPAMAKFMLVVGIAVPASFGLAFGLRKLPWLGQIVE